MVVMSAKFSGRILWTAALAVLTVAIAEAQSRPNVVLPSKAAQ
jgi:hypothetical protein